MWWSERRTLDQCVKFVHDQEIITYERDMERIERAERYISIMRLIMVECGHKVEAVSLNA